MKTAPRFEHASCLVNDGCPLFETLKTRKPCLCPSLSPSSLELQANTLQTPPVQEGLRGHCSPLVFLLQTRSQRRALLEEWDR